MAPEVEVIVRPESVWMVTAGGKVPYHSIRQLLFASCLGRPFLVVTETPQKTSWCRAPTTTSVLSQKEQVVAGTNFCVTVLSSANAEVMEGLATEEELNRGLLWASPVVVPVRCEELIEMREWLSMATFESVAPSCLREHVACLSDGAEALWCHPSQANLGKARAQFGW